MTTTIHYRHHAWVVVCDRCDEELESFDSLLDASRHDASEHEADDVVQAALDDEADSYYDAAL